MKCLKIKLFFVFLLIILKTQAQETEIYTERNQHLKKGMEWIDNKNYLSAQKEFQLAFEETKHHLDNEQIMLNIISEYYNAYCAYQLNQANTELLYKNFIKNHHETVYRRKAYFDLGTYYFNNKKTADAMKWYEKVNPKDLTPEELANFQFNMAYTYFKRKQFMQAKPLFAKIKNSQSIYSEPATYYYAFISFYNQEYKNAKKDFESLKNSKLYAKVVPYYLVQIYYMEQKYQQVIDYAEPLLQDNKTKNRKEISHIVGQAYFELGNYTESIPLLQNYIKNTRKVSKEEMFQLAYAQYKTKQYSQAIKNLMPLSVVKDSLGQNAMYLLGNAYLETNNKSMAKDAYLTASALDFDQEISMTSAFQHAKLAYDLGEYTIATNALTQFIAKYPQSVYRAEALDLVSNVLLETKNYQKAIDIIEQNQMNSSKIRATYQKVCLYRAIELYNDGNNTNALTYADKSMQNAINQDLKAQAIFLKGLLFYADEKYVEAISALSWFKQFNVQSNEEWANKKLANYNMAYAYFKQKKYAKASTYFEEALKTFHRATERSYIADCHLRNADCLLMIKNYDRALNNYDKIIDNNWSAKEYALLQKSVIYGLQGKFNQKITTLNTLLSEYPQSHYADQSQFEIADAYMQLVNINTSLVEFKKLIQKYPNSKLIPDAYLKIGLLYSNAGKDQKALEAYKTVVKKYPNSEKAKEALIALKGLYMAMGKPNDYIRFVETEAGLSVSVSEQENLLFESAEEKYLSGNCQQTISIINDYLDLFPEGKENISAHYFRADCSFKAKDYTQAYTDYLYVAGKGQSKYLEESLLKSSYIAYEIEQDFTKANVIYNDLYKVASKKSNKEIAQIGLMRTYFKLGSNLEVLNYANEVITDENISEKVKNEATYYKAKALFATQKLNQAKVVFEEVVAQQAISKIKAESAYHIALIKYQQQQYEASKADCFTIKDEYASYTYWVVKTFILLADNYTALDNVFQAKATLQSIIKNYKGDQELIDEANRKYNALLEKELQDTKIDMDSTNTKEVKFEEE